MRRYAAAFALVGLAVALRIWPLNPMGARTVWLTFYPAVMGAALYGGVGAGLFATLLSCLAVLFLLPVVIGVPFIVDSIDWITLVVFVATTAIIAGAAELMHRARAREAVSKDELDRFFSLSLDMLCISSADGHFKRVSAAFTRTLGWSEAEMLARPYLQCVHPDDVEATQREVERQVVAGESVLAFENRYQHKNGSWRTLSWRSVPQPGGLMYATARDVTEARRIEVELRRQAALLDRSADAILVRELDGTVSYWNEGAERLYGYSRAEAIGANKYALLRTRIAVPRSDIDAALADTGEWRGEVEHTHRDGRELTLSARWVVEPAHNGMPARVLETNTDITERKTHERALAAASLAAEHANRAKSQFLANMSHELRTPLNSIIGFSEILENQTVGALNDKQRHYIGNVLAGGRRLIELINDILDLAKIEAGRLELAPRPFAPGHMLEGTLNIVRGLAMKKGIELVAESEPDLPPLVADESKIKQVLYNLLSNALKFTPDGGRVAVTMRRIQAGDAQERLRVSVSDTGVGINPIDHARIWDEFVQVDSTYARTQKGTGLGLALSRRLVELHGGRIWVESEGIEGRGSTFTFELPIVVVRESPLDAAPSPHGAPGAAPDPDPDMEPPQPHADPARPLVLVVEDDAAARALLDDYLQSGGYTVAHARTAAQAAEMARALRPMAITLDILLPDRPGWEVLAQLKSDARTRDIPVVIVSITDDTRLGFSLGAVDFLVKPVQREAVLAAIRRASARRPQPIRSVLIIDDDAATIESLRVPLAAAGYTVQSATTGADGIALVHVSPPDLLVLDLLMTPMHGFEVIERLRADPRSANLPILVFTAMHLSAEDHARLNRQVQQVAAKPARESLLAAITRLAAERGGVGGSA